MFSDILKQLRKRKQISQIELAASLGVSRSTIGMYEAGERMPDYEMMKSISTFFGVSTDYLYGKTVQETPLPTQTEQENTLLKAFRGTTEEGRMRIIQAVLNICDEIEREEIKAKSQSTAG